MLKKRKDLVISTGILFLCAVALLFPYMIGILSAPIRMYMINYFCITSVSISEFIRGFLFMAIINLLYMIFIDKMRTSSFYNRLPAIFQYRCFFFLLKELITIVMGTVMVLSLVLNIWGSWH